MSKLVGIIQGEVKTQKWSTMKDRRVSLEINHPSCIDQEKVEILIKGKHVCYNRKVTTQRTDIEYIISQPAEGNERNKET